MTQTVKLDTIKHSFTDPFTDSFSLYKSRNKNGLGLFLCNSTPSYCKIVLFHILPTEHASKTINQTSKGFSWCWLIVSCGKRETSPAHGSMETPESEQRLNEQPSEEGMSAMACSPPIVLLRSVEQWQGKGTEDLASPICTLLSQQCFANSIFA